MRTDTIFYQLFLTFPNLLFELLKQSPVEGYQFSSREVKELARRFDGIFLPPENDRNKPIYFVEVQFQEKGDFWWRFITEIMVYLGQYQPLNDWHCLALFANRKLDTGIPFAYRNLVSNEQIHIFYLDELETEENSSIALEIISLIMSKESEAISKAKKTVSKMRVDETFKVNQTQILQLIETVLVYKLNNMTREEIEAMFTFEDLKQTRYFQDVAAEAEKKGELKGELKGKLETIPLLIELGISVEKIANRLNLPLDMVKEAVKKASENHLE
ncbi:Rpn family recombination-promoting nuclease/putative transposase [Geminocystis sp. GBBB08]|uniref:Rpn family recombination-promoting nuclease/putative transposase n=1 Tax=Geminocystis sp. GBBB08 TaxID=2604140 RepID=UPI0027E2BD2E|nr:Rpn family recombination-promoting nuclease/putative transposase [Geminocystis sp. GBBB08]MBL1210246.1 Rpn family recombination-promoting nuclease/putative transposase [Geminocystis sp. GBBB08]